MTTRTTPYAFVLLLPALMLSASISMARMDARPFPFRKDLIREEGVHARVGCFALDSAIYAATDPHYANLRILDTQHAELPYYLRGKIHTTTQIVETAIASRVLDFEENAGNQARIFIEVEKPSLRPQVLILRTHQRNYEKLVSVFGGNSMSQWEPLVEDSRIYDFTRHIDVRNNRIEIPPHSFRYLRIDLSNFVEQKARAEYEVVTESRGEVLFSRTERRTLREESIRIEGVELRAKSEVIRPNEPFFHTVVISDLIAETDDKAQASILTFETDRRPLVSLTLETPSRNFSRRTLVEGSHGGHKPLWSRLGESTIFSLDLDTVAEHRLTIPLARESRYERYRITIFNQDNPPLEVSGFIATGLVHEVLFMADPSIDYHILYGGDSIPAPRYDIGAVLKNAPSLETVPYTPSDESANPLYKEGFRPGGLKPKVFFGIAVAVMICLLSWLIAKGAGKVEQMP